MGMTDVLPARIAARVEVTDSGCWEWMGARDPLGYGRIRVAPHTRSVHREVYIALFGDPGKLSVDHLCRNPPCCNPNHLEAVTQRENVLRGLASAVAKRRFAEHKFCPQGHPLSGDNLYTHLTKTGYVNKQCRTCRRDTKRARRAAGARN